MTETPELPTPDHGTARMSVRRRSGLAAAGATAVAGAIMVLSAVGASNATAAADKYYVCKYVGTPGVNETLQTGQNPIDVSANAIGDPVVVGAFFNDSQGRSYVLAADTGQGEPPVTDCPPPNGGGSSSTPASSTPASSTPASSTPASSTPASSTPASSTPVTVTDTATASGTEVVTTTAAAGSSGAAGQQAGGQAVGGQQQGPIPAGVNAGLHTPVGNAGLRAWGIVLMLLGGAAGLVFGLRPSSRRAH